MDKSSSLRRLSLFPFWPGLKALKGRKVGEYLDGEAKAGGRFESLGLGGRFWSRFVEHGVEWLYGKMVDV